MTFNTLKDPDAIADYTIDWSAVLGADTIATSTWTADSGITIVSDSHGTQTALVRLSGGTLQESYSVRNRIVTAGAQQFENTITVTIQSQ